MASIPASQLVSIQPGAISAGGNPLALNSVFLTENTVIPIGQILSFPTQSAVASYFGPASTEAGLAKYYFGGFSNMTQVPGALFFSQFQYSAVAGWMRGGALTLTLAQLKAITPATSTGSSISATTLTIGSLSTGAYTAGMLLTGSGVTLGTRIVKQLTGPVGGAGTYQVDTSQTAASESITGAYDLTVTIDGGSPLIAASLDLSAATSFSNAATLISSALGLSGGQAIAYSSQFAAFTITSGTTGALSSVIAATGEGATALSFTTVTGAVVSPGSAGMAEGAALTAITNITQNWAAFMTTWEPTLPSKMNFAAWVNGSNQRYMYVAYDSDITVTQSAQTVGPTSFGPLVDSYNGVVPVYLDPNVAAMICGTTAAVDFNRKNGRITYAYKGQAGLTPSVTDATMAANLIANGYNFYGSYATANQQFTWLQPGQISGAWDWIDEYVNQISMNAAFQLAGMVLLTSVNSLPYNKPGYQTLKNAWSGTIQQYVDFGAIVPGVTLSSTQIQEVNTAAGLAIDGVIFSTGYYLQVLDANPIVRGQRGSPPCTFWYADGGSIQKLNLSFIDLQ